MTVSCYKLREKEFFLIVLNVGDKTKSVTQQAISPRKLGFFMHGMELRPLLLNHMKFESIIIFVDTCDIDISQRSVRHL